MNATAAISHMKKLSSSDMAGPAGLHVPDIVVESDCTLEDVEDNEEEKLEGDEDEACGGGGGGGGDVLDPNGNRLMLPPHVEHDPGLCPKLRSSHSEPINHAPGMVESGGREYNSECSFDTIDRGKTSKGHTLQTGVCSVM